MFQVRAQHLSMPCGRDAHGILGVSQMGRNQAVGTREVVSEWVRAGTWSSPSGREAPLTALSKGTTGLGLSFGGRGCEAVGGQGVWGHC